MKITDFTANHIERAIAIAKQNYEAERRCVPALPPLNEWPDMTGFAHNNLGAAAFDGDRMLGFLCVWDPWDNAWDMQGLRHLFSPMHGNGTVPENRAKIYARLYQAAGEKWARAGAASHGICLYAHDTVGQEQFFRYGFGARTVDAIRGMDEIKAPPCEGYTFCEPAPEEVIEILPLENLHMAGYIDSPFFMVRQQDSETGFWEEYQKVRPVYFLARYNGTAIAYIKAELDGETFIQNTSGYLHVKGLYCLPEHRGKGVPQTLLNCLTQKLKSQGYVRLGVDFESFNPSGSGFWHKYFTAYTYGVVRRIDESAILKIREGC